MQIPIWAPARPGVEKSEIAFVSSDATGAAADVAGLEPAACCAEACVNIPFVGRVCHCVLDLPICP